MERAPLPMAIWLLAIVTGVLAIPRGATPDPAALTIILPVPRQAVVVDPFAEADKLYRARRFTDAAVLLASYDRYADNMDYSTTATHYKQLARAWAIGMDPSTPPSDALLALREAAKLDLVLGGAFTDEILARERAIAPLAVDELIAHGDRDGAEEAQHVVDTLGR